MSTTTTRMLPATAGEIEAARKAAAADFTAAAKAGDVAAMEAIQARQRELDSQLRPAQLAEAKAVIDALAAQIIEARANVDNVGDATEDMHEARRKYEAAELAMREALGEQQMIAARSRTAQYQLEHLQEQHRAAQQRFEALLAGRAVAG